MLCNLLLLKTVLVLGLTLAGIIDGSVARYIHLVADLIDVVEWQEVSDFATFAEVLYPFLHVSTLYYCKHFPILIAVRCL